MTHVELLIDGYVPCDKIRDLPGGSSSREFCGGNIGDGVTKNPSGGIIWVWDKVCDDWSY